MIADDRGGCAVGGLGGGNATDEMIISNIRASDTWAFYQAKNVRQTMYEIELAELEDACPAPLTAPRSTRASPTPQPTIARYDNEPDPEAPAIRCAAKARSSSGPGPRRSKPRATWRMAQDDNFDLAEVALQLALVLGSVRSSRPTARSSSPRRAGPLRPSAAPPPVNAGGFGNTQHYPPPFTGEVSAKRTEGPARALPCVVLDQIVTGTRARRTASAPPSAR
jgi:hypothetical protein